MSAGRQSPDDRRAHSGLHTPANNATAILIAIAVVCGTLMLICGGVIVGGVIMARQAGEQMETVMQEAVEEATSSQEYLVFIQQGQFREALQALDAALIEMPVDAELHNLKGWLLATLPDDDLRDGATAVTHASQACELTDWRSVAFLDTLAAAYAEAGDFNSAVVYQQSAMDRDKSGTFGPGLEQRLQLYRSRQPYREDPRTQQPVLPQGVAKLEDSGRLSNDLVDSIVGSAAAAVEPEPARDESESPDEIPRVTELRRFEGHQGKAIFGLAFTPDGQHIISCGDDEVIRMWDVNSTEEVRVFTGHTDAVGCVALSQDGSRLLSGSWDLTMRMWDLQTGETVREYFDHRWPVLTVAISPDGKRALSGSDGFRLWDLESGAVLWHDRSHTWTVWSVTFSPDGQHALTGSWDESVRLWDVTTSASTRRQRALPIPGRVKCVRFDPQGRYLAAATTIGTSRVGVWELESFRELPGFEGHRNGIGWVDFSPDGTRIASTSGRQDPDDGGYLNDLPDQTVRLWDIATGREIARLEGHEAYVSGVAFSPDGSFLASSALDGTVRVWEVP